MLILGLHITGNQTSAALLKNGKIIYGVGEERFTRIKNSRSFPVNAIEFCLKSEGIDDIQNLDGIAISWNPSENMRNINSSGFTEWRRYDPEWLYIAPNNLLENYPNLDTVGDYLKINFGENIKVPIYFIKHHYAHLADAIYQSPFNKGFAAVIDEYSERQSVTLGTFRNNKLSVIKTIDYPNSLGVFYSAITELIGFKPNSDEWKLMGASAYGNPKRFNNKMEKIFSWNKAEGEWILNTQFIEHSNMRKKGYCNEKIEKFFGLKKNKNKYLEKDYYDIAASAQEIFEKRLYQILNHYNHKTRQKNLVAAGGCFMNSLANGKITKKTNFKKLFIPYAAADNGGATGAALYVWHRILKNNLKNFKVPPSPYLGPSFNNSEIEQTLKNFKLNFTKINNISRKAAEIIAEGKILGWFQGKMEFGERALGARSIIADPRIKQMKNLINAAVKYRESFRPFAPSIIIDKAPEWFEIEKGVNVPYMEQVYKVKKNKRSLVPSIVHNDGTGRLQTVIKSLNPKFYNLIVEFYKITKVPIVINTSFNLNNEPIVCSPKDAIRTFYSSGIDTLIIENFLVYK